MVSTAYSRRSNARASAYPLNSWRSAQVQARSNTGGEFSAPPSHNLTMSTASWRCSAWRISLMVWWTHEGAAGPSINTPMRIGAPSGAATPLQDHAMFARCWSDIFDNPIVSIGLARISVGKSGDYSREYELEIGLDGLADARSLSTCTGGIPLTFRPPGVTAIF